MDSGNRLVERLLETDTHEIELLLKEVWLKAVEYPKSWRKMRTINQEQIAEEMSNGFTYFWVHACMNAWTTLENIIPKVG